MTKKNGRAYKQLHRFPSTPVAEARRAYTAQGLLLCATILDSTYIRASKSCLQLNVEKTEYTLPSTEEAFVVVKLTSRKRPTHRGVPASPRVQDVKPRRVGWVHLVERRERIVDEPFEHVLDERWS